MRKVAIFILIGILLLMTSQKYPTVIIEKCPTPL